MISKILNLVAVCAVFFAWSIANAGETKCLIYVAGACPINDVVATKVPTNQWFEDSYGASHASAGVCLHRASDYRAYCQMPPDPAKYVNAAFTLGGRTINAQQFRGGADPVTTFGLDWAPIVTKY